MEGIYLKAGLCTGLGCAKGGNYEICCSTSGGNCPHSCSAVIILVLGVLVTMHLTPM